MIIRSRAPLRIGLAGGGTDIESYSGKHGGVVLNASINMYAYCTIIPTTDGVIKINSYDNNSSLETKSVPRLELEGNNLILHRGVYNRIVSQFNGGKSLSFYMSTSNDAPIGSGLGTSSTMVVAILEAFNKWLNLGLNKHQMAELAYDIERKDLKLEGGKQDQYAAVFGGFNFMEFNTDNTVTINPLNLDKNRVRELENSIVLYYSGKSRSSAKVQLELTNNIIASQIEGSKNNHEKTLDAMQKLKEIAGKMKEDILLGRLDCFAKALRDAWENKKKTSSIVSNKELENIIELASINGAEAVKVSGAGGGGFLLIYFNPINRQKLIDGMSIAGGKVYPISFTFDGVESWIL